MSALSSPGTTGAGGGRATAVATGVATLGAAPVFTVGAAAVFMEESIGFRPADLGLSVFVFYVVAAVLGPPLGAVVGRWGSRRAMAVATLSGLAAMAGLAAAPSRLAVFALMALAGFANGMAQLSANVHLSSAVSPARRGLAFGIRRSAIPLASALAGAAVPAVALTAGWRYIFVVFAGLAVAALAAAAAERRRVVRGPRGETALSPGRLPELRLLAAANLLGTAATTAMSTFLVVFLTTAHTSAALAGTMGLLGGLSSIVARVLLGVAADRRPLPALGVIGAMMLLGAVAVGVFALDHSTPAVLAAVIVAYLLGWGWTGLIDLHVVRRNAASPGRATGMTYAGAALGAGAGPLVMGWLVDHHGYTTAWWSAAATMAAAGLLVLLSPRPSGGDDDPRP